MTQLGQQNHCNSSYQQGKYYNIKLLKGYGVSINLKNNHIVLKNGKDPFSEEQETEEWFVTQIPYEKIVISGKGYVSTDAIKLLSEKNVNVILTDTYGNLVSSMNHTMSSFASSKYRMGQYDTFRDPDKVRYLRKQLLSAKLSSQIDFLKSIERSEVSECIFQLSEFKRQVENCKEYRDFLTLESRAGIIYFRNYAKLFEARYKFRSRIGGGLVTSHRDASDVINALLNYGYTVLAGEITKFVNGVGLDAYYGFYHRSHMGFQSLIYDLMEPFRWLVEYTVYKIADSRKSYRNTIHEKDYAWTREGKIVLDSDLIRRFLIWLSKKFESRRLYMRNGGGMKRDDGMSKCQEITIAKISVQNLADYCIGKRRF